MPKNNCLFQARWLQDEWFKHRIRFKHWIQTVAICNYFSKGVSVANMEKAALTSHMKGKKHIERSPNQCIKSLMSPTPAPPPAMGIGGGIQQYRCNCHPLLVL